MFEQMKMFVRIAEMGSITRAARSLGLSLPMASRHLRWLERKDDRDPVSGPNVANAQMAAFREWETFKGERFAELKSIRHPVLVVNGVHDEMIPVSNSYRLSENLPNAVLPTYPDAGHGSLFQYPESFTRHVAAFLSSASESAAF
jgi:pimeloyl-ACP methyl ester carboxylesterase